MAKREITSVTHPNGGPAVVVQTDDDLYGFECGWDSAVSNARCKFRSYGWPSVEMAVDRACHHYQEHETGRLCAIWRAKANRRYESFREATPEEQETRWIEFQQALSTAEDYESDVVLMQYMDEFKSQHGWDPVMTTQQYLEATNGN